LTIQPCEGEGESVNPESETITTRILPTHQLFPKLCTARSDLGLVLRQLEKRERKRIPFVDELLESARSRRERE